VSHLRTFGSPVFAHVSDDKRRKLDPKATEGIMVGYGDSSRVYKIWDPVARNIITSRDVVFEEKLIFENSSVPEELDYYSLITRFFKCRLRSRWYPTNFVAVWAYPPLNFCCCFSPC
jgi:hypothetical protein